MLLLFISEVVTKKIKKTTKKGLFYMIISNLYQILSNLKIMLLLLLQKNNECYLYALTKSLIKTNVLTT